MKISEESPLRKRQNRKKASAKAKKARKVVETALAVIQPKILFDEPGPGGSPAPAQAERGPAERKPAELSEYQKQGTAGLELARDFALTIGKADEQLTQRVNEVLLSDSKLKIHVASIAFSRKYIESIVSMLGVLDKIEAEIAKLEFHKMEGPELAAYHQLVTNRIELMLRFLLALAALEPLERIEPTIIPEEVAVELAKRVGPEIENLPVAARRKVVSIMDRINSRPAVVEALAAQAESAEQGHGTDAG